MLDETARSRSADRYVVHGAMAERLNAVVRLVGDTLAFPTVRVNIIDEHTQHTISLCGAGDPAPVARQQAFCDIVVRTEHPLIVQDAADDPQFAGHAAVVSGDVGSYLGVPLVGREGLVVGALCMLDPARRTINSYQIQLLLQFSRMIERQLDLIRREHESHLVEQPTGHTGSRSRRRGTASPWHRRPDSP